MSTTPTINFRLQFEDYLPEDRLQAKYDALMASEIDLENIGLFIRKWLKRALIGLFYASAYTALYITYSVIIIILLAEWATRRGVWRLRNKDVAKPPKLHLVRL